MSQEFELAQREVSELVGLECWDAIMANGEYLQIEIGGVVPIKGLRRSATMGTHGAIVKTDWEIRTADGAVLAREDDDEARIDEALSRLRGEIVSVDVGPSDLTLKLAFANGVWLIARAPKLPVHEPLWKVFLPDDRMITAGESGLSRGRSDE